MTGVHDDPVPGLLDRLTARREEMVTLLDALVSSESPSADAGRLTVAADLLAERGTRLLGVAPQRTEPADSPVLRWDLPAVACDASPVVLLGHLDTVWPAGTTARWPFSVEGDRATGPGAFDMKAGLVQGLFALAELLETDLPRPPIVVLITLDEEIGSAASRPVLEQAARGASAVLVLEASQVGALKVARKGVGNYRLSVTGRAAHAGLEPEKGVNALVAAAHLVLAVEALAATDLGTTVTPTLASAGTTQNTVPATASVSLDVRASSVAEQQRVDLAVHALATDVRAADGVPSPGGSASVVVEGGVNRPPLEEGAAAELMGLAQRAAVRCGLPPLEAARVGGASDGNFTAAMGVRTLDGLGAVGGGAHAEGEWVLVAAMPERAALLATVILELAEPEETT